MLHVLFTAHLKKKKKGKSPDAKKRKMSTFPLSVVLITCSYKTLLFPLTVSWRLIASTVQLYLLTFSSDWEKPRYRQRVLLTGIQPWGTEGAGHGEQESEKNITTRNDPCIWTVGYMGLFKL